jgi:hypothetical protein
MKRVGGLFAPIRGEAAPEFCNGEFFEGALRGRGRSENDHLGSGGDINRRHPNDSADGPHFDDDFARIRAFDDHVGSRDSVQRNDVRFPRPAQCANLGESASVPV